MAQGANRYARRTKTGFADNLTCTTLVQTMPKQQLPEEHRKRLKMIRDKNDVMRFCKEDAGINYRTFCHLEDGGKSDQVIVHRVISGLQPTASAEVVQTIVCTSYGISAHRLVNGVDVTTREARQVAMMFMKSMSRMSRTAIQAHFGYEDETTVTKGLQSLESRMSVETPLRELVSRIKIKIQEAA